MQNNSNTPNNNNSRRNRRSVLNRHSQSSHNYQHHFDLSEVFRHNPTSSKTLNNIQQVNDFKFQPIKPEPANSQASQSSLSFYDETQIRMNATSFKVYQFLSIGSDSLLKLQLSMSNSNEPQGESNEESKFLEPNKVKAASPIRHKDRKGILNEQILSTFASDLPVTGIFQLYALPLGTQQICKMKTQSRDSFEEKIPSETQTQEQQNIQNQNFQNNPLLKLQYLNEQQQPSTFIDEFLEISFAKYEAVRVLSPQNVLQNAFKLSRKVKIGGGGPPRSSQDATANIVVDKRKTSKLPQNGQKTKETQDQQQFSFNVMLFVMESQDDFLKWETAMSNYVVQGNGSVTEHYDVKEKLGQGTFGNVYLATAKYSAQSSGLSDSSAFEKVAIKILKKHKISESKQGREFLLNEIRVHWALEQCVSVLRLLKLYEDSECVCIVLEYQSKGSLMNIIMKRVKLDEQEVRIIMEQMLLALDFFQRKKVIHRDIKLDNVLINQIEDKGDYEIRVADFGLAAFNPKDEPLLHKCGSPGYVAPEVFRGSGYSYHADIFSLGAVFFNLISGRYLFSGKDLQELLKRNIECETGTIKQFLATNSPQCRDLMMWMIEVDPINRPSAKQALKHPWFTQDKQIIKDLLNINDLICSQAKPAGNQRLEDHLQKLNIQTNALLGGMPSMIFSNDNSQYPHEGLGSFNLGNQFRFSPNMVKQSADNRADVFRSRRDGVSPGAIFQIPRSASFKRPLSYAKKKSIQNQKVGNNPTVNLNFSTLPREMIQPSPKQPNPMLDEENQKPVSLHINRAISNVSLRVSYFQALRQSKSNRRQSVNQGNPNSFASRNLPSGPKYVQSQSPALTLNLRENSIRQQSKFKKQEEDYNNDNQRSMTQQMKRRGSRNLTKQAIEESKNENLEESLVDQNFGGGAGNMKESGDEQSGEAPQQIKISLQEEAKIQPQKKENYVPTNDRQETGGEKPQLQAREKKAVLVPFESCNKLPNMADIPPQKQRVPLHLPPQPVAYVESSQVIEETQLLLSVPAVYQQQPSHMENYRQLNVTHENMQQIPDIMSMSKRNKPKIRRLFLDEI